LTNQYNVVQWGQLPLQERNKMPFNLPDIDQVAKFCLDNNYDTGCVLFQSAGNGEVLPITQAYIRHKLDDLNRNQIERYLEGHPAILLVHREDKPSNVVVEFKFREEGCYQTEAIFGYFRKEKALSALSRVITAIDDIHPIAAVKKMVAMSKVRGEEKLKQFYPKEKGIK